jgi:hypothetical protein
MNDVVHAISRILIGPTYLEGVEAVAWPSKRVLYLRKTRDPEPRDPKHVYYDERSIQEGIVDKAIDDRLGKLIVDLNKDISCYFLAERERKDIFDGTFLAPVEISNCARYAWSILVDNRIDLLIFHNHPHELFT